MKPVRPSAPIRETYEHRLLRLVEQMQRDVAREVLRAYKANPPVHTLVAMDASPSRVLQGIMDRLARDWLRRFGELAPKLAERFVTDVKDRNDRQLRADLRRARFTVRFRMTAAMNDAFQAVRAENVGLIKSIASQHLTQVETLVQQSVQTGRDLAHVAQGLEKRLGVTRRRAALIARDQNNKATAVLLRARWLDMGITKARWLHSAGGNQPRPEHVAFSGKTFDVAKGHDFRNGEGVVWPGTAINCKCVMQPVIPGFDED